MDPVTGIIVGVGYLANTMIAAFGLRTQRQVAQGQNQQVGPVPQGQNQPVAVAQVPNLQGVFGPNAPAAPGLPAPGGVNQGAGLAPQNFIQANFVEGRAF